MENRAANEGREEGKGRGVLSPPFALQSEGLVLREHTLGTGDPTKMEPLEEAQRATAPHREGKGAGSVS